MFIKLNKPISNLQDVEAHDTDPLACLTFSYDYDFLATTSKNGYEIRVFKSKHFQLLHKLERSCLSTARINALHFSRDSAFLACSSEDRPTVHIFRIGDKPLSAEQPQPAPTDNTESSTSSVISQVCNGAWAASWYGVGTAFSVASWGVDTIKSVATASAPGRRSFAKIKVDNVPRVLGFLSDSRRGQLSLATSSRDDNLLQLFNVVPSGEEECAEVARLETDPKTDPETDSWDLIEDPELDALLI